MLQALSLRWLVACLLAGGLAGCWVVLLGSGLISDAPALWRRYMALSEEGSRPFWKRFRSAPERGRSSGGEPGPRALNASRGPPDAVHSAPRQRACRTRPHARRRSRAFQRHSVSSGPWTVIAATGGVRRPVDGGSPGAGTCRSTGPSTVLTLTVVPRMASTDEMEAVELTFTPHVRAVLHGDDHEQVGARPGPTSIS